MTPKVKGVLTFLVLAFGLAWASMFAARLLWGLSLADPRVQLPMAFAPAIAAVVVRRWVTREGFADAGLALRVRPAWTSYLMAWFGPLFFVLGTVAVAGASGVRIPDWSALDRLVDGVPGWAVILVLLALLPLLAPVYWGEEFGWTSYLRLRLFPARPVASVVVTGLIWAVWHYPLAFLGYVHFPNVVLGLTSWTVSFVLQEIILAWLRQRGASVWVPSLAHAGNNMVLFLLSGALLTRDGVELDPTLVNVFASVPMAVLCVWILGTGRLRPLPTGLPVAASTPGERVGGRT
ncbi:CPBP family intramembrane glutamic endopeptidase [Longispora urticae]